MSQQVAVSFEGGTIRVVYASSHRGKLTVRKTLQLQDEELDTFLKKEKTESFTVVCDFTSFYQEMLLLPPVKSKYLRPVVESELKKRLPELKDFSFFFVVKGETQVEGKKRLETFVFAVDNNELFGLIDRFGRCGKTVRSIYAGAFTLSRLVDKACGPLDEPLLCVTGSGTIKTFFLMDKGRLQLVRTVQSPGSGISDLDIQNINMTINYCRQTARMTPSLVNLLGAYGSFCDTRVDLMAPATCMINMPDISAPAEVVQDFMSPISALLPEGDLDKGDLLPLSYRNMQSQKKILSGLTAFFILFSLSGLAYIKTGLSEIRQLNERSLSIGRDIADMEPQRRAYEALRSELMELSPYADLINSSNSSPDVQKAFVALQSLSVENAVVQSIDAAEEGTSLRIRVKGDITSKNYSGMQKTYHGLLGSIRKTRGLEILSDKIDLSDKKFMIEATYRQ